MANSSFMIGTTPTHYFKTDIDTSMIVKLKITYKQGDEIILTKKLEDCVLEGDTISTTLTQEETFKFDISKLVRIQLRGVTVSGEAIGTDPINVTAKECLDDEVL